MLHSTKRVAIKIQNEESKYLVKHILKWLNYNLMSSFIFALLHFFLGKAHMLRKYIFDLCFSIVLYLVGDA